MTVLHIASAVCLSIVAVTTATGVFSRNYRENWLQFAGLVGTCVWSSARVAQLTDLSDNRLPLQGILLHASLASYALGTAWNVWMHRNQQQSARAAQ